MGWAGVIGGEVPIAGGMQALAVIWRQGLVEKGALMRELKNL